MKLFSRRRKEKSRVERYLGHLDSWLDQEPEFFGDPERKAGVSTLLYRNYPESGMVSGFTYGLSLRDHPSWTQGKPELFISVASSDESWVAAAGAVAGKLAGDCPFSYGSTIDFNGPISTESEMDAFLVFAPSLPDKELYLNIPVGDRLPIHIAGLYPIYSSEIALIREWGLKAFWHHPGFDMFDVKRRRMG